MNSAVPVYRADFYSDEFIADPWLHYAEMRRLGPVVWLEKHQNYALTRHAEVAAALRDQATFISGAGVAADAAANELTRGNSAGSDGERHSAIRGATAPPLLPGAIERIRGQIDAAAVELVERLVRQSRFDAMRELAPHLPLTIVRDLVGLPDSGRDNMLRWANATFDLLGVQNERGKAAVDVFLEQRRFAQTQARPDVLKPGSWTRRLFDLVEEGDLAPDLAPVAMRDYLNPSLDTTISATGQLIYQLGANPDQWKLLREKPELARNAANEAVRLASPVRSFSRHTSRDVEVGDVMIPEGARVMMLFASANRDERVFDKPDTFDITRSPRHHLGFGSGIHMCVGQHLAQMEMVSLLEAMIPRIETIEVGRPTVAMNNTIYGFASLPTNFVGGQRAGAPISALVAAAPQPELFKVLCGRIAARSQIAQDVVELRIEPHQGVSFPKWSPGAHIDLHLRDGLVRQYSLTGPGCAGDDYRVAVQLEPMSRGGSKAVHEKLSPGKAILLSRPRNHFPLDETAKHTALFSGGIGLTPILAMAWRLHELGRAFVWHLSARSRARLPYAGQLDELPFRHAIELHIGDETTQAWDAEAVIRSLPRETHLYVCGPSGYMNKITSAASRADLSPDQVHLEHFAAEIDVNGDPFTVIAARSGREVEVGSDESILTALSRIDIDVPTSCQNGVCGTCLTRVIKGRPDHRDLVLTEAEKAEGDRIAVCCSRSQSATLVLDL